MMPCTEPMTCLSAYCLPWCCVRQQRIELLENDMTRYICCAGIMGHTCTNWCTENCTHGREDVCLCVESFICLGCAIHGNRYMVMSHYGLTTDCCDIFILYLSCICSILACLCQNDLFETLADIIYYMTVGCMVAQHQHEMKTFGYPQKGSTAGAVGGVMPMTRIG